ncbi:MAG: hypothetical protein K6F61_05875 [Clostridiales bacterium]|nr:hypothetical protein [Clostridiales bacterium]
MTFRKHLLAAALGIVLLLGCVSAVHAENLTDTERNLTEAEQNLAEHGLVLKDVVNEYFGFDTGSHGFVVFLPPYRPDGDPNFIFFDVTGDGCMDLCTQRVFGSGMTRVEAVVFDPLAHERYILDGYDYFYFIEGVSDGRFVVVECGPYGYGEPLTDTWGTVAFEDGRLVFVPDEVQPSSGTVSHSHPWFMSAGDK